jgi:lysophospholipase L1-like esterase
MSTGIAGTDYAQVVTTFVAPSGCSSVVLYFVPDNSSAGNIAYFDDVSVKQFVTSETLQPLSIQTVLNNLPSAAITFSDPNGVMTSTNVHDAIIEAYNHGSGSSATLVSPRINLPDTLYAVVGDKLQLFIRGIIEAQNPYNLPYVINSSVGASYPRYFEYTPLIGDVGTKSFTVKVLNYDYSVLGTKTVNLKVSNPTGQPASNKNILCLGDSLTGGGAWPAELYRRLTQTGGTPAGLGYGNITFIGDKALPGYSSQAYTGYGGWSFPLYNGTSSTTSGHVLTGTFDKDKSDVNSTWLDTNGVIWAIEYATGGLKIHGSGTLPSSGTLTHVSGATHTSDIVYTSATSEPQSPFWDSVNGRFSFSGWATRNGYSEIDAVYVLLGWNSTGGANVTDYSSYMENVRTFLNQLHADFPNTIVRIVGIQIPSVNGGLGANYGANGGISEYYGMVRSANSMNIAYQNLANEAAYSSWVKFVSVAPQFDSENNMPQALTTVNSRSSVTEQRGTNGVHPNTAGYYQIADAVYREFVSTFVSN